jgi:hypothetical protein
MRFPIIVAGWQLLTVNRRRRQLLIIHCALLISPVRKVILYRQNDTKILFEGGKIDYFGGLFKIIFTLP